MALLVLFAVVVLSLLVAVAGAAGLLSTLFYVMTTVQRRHGRAIPVRHAHARA